MGPAEGIMHALFAYYKQWIRLKCFCSWKYNLFIYVQAAGLY